MLDWIDGKTAREASTCQQGYLVEALRVTYKWEDDNSV